MAKCNLDDGCEVNILRLKRPYMRRPCLSTCSFVYRSLISPVVKPFQNSSSEREWLPSIMFYPWSIMRFLILFMVSLYAVAVTVVNRPPCCRLRSTRPPGVDLLDVASSRLFGCAFVTADRWDELRRRPSIPLTGQCHHLVHESADLELQWYSPSPQLTFSFNCASSINAFCL